MQYYCYNVAYFYAYLCSPFQVLQTFIRAWNASTRPKTSRQCEARFNPFYNSIQNVFFAATDEKGGGILSNARVYDTDKHLWLPAVRQLPEFADESAELLRDFFQKFRKNKEVKQ